MGNSLRCCLACVLPCGAFDLVRIVHLSGRIDEYGRRVTAQEILVAYPGHLLGKPSTEGVVGRMLIVSPDSELKRGHIYFLIPATAAPPEKKRHSSHKRKYRSSTTSLAAKVSKEDDNYLAEILSESKPACRRCRGTGRRATVWRPHLNSIPEES